MDYKKFFVSICVFILCNCNSTKKALDTDTLPKDIALKPVEKVEEPFDLEKEKINLEKLLKIIDSLSYIKKCTAIEDWRTTPLGSKNCGGPVRYLPYHKDIEKEILPKVQEYTRRQSNYNRFANEFSDCAVEPQPKGLQCENGKAIIIY